MAASLAGDLGGQAAVERQLGQAGQRRTDVGREAFVERVRAFEADCRAQTTAQVAELGIDVDLDAGTVDREPVARAARTAFVRLYEAGLLLSREERVVDTCPRCETVVDRADLVPPDVAGERLTVRLELLGRRRHGRRESRGAELLPGVVAVAVPEGRSGRRAAAEVPPWSTTPCRWSPSRA